MNTTRRSHLLRAIALVVGMVITMTGCEMHDDDHGDNDHEHESHEQEEVSHHD